MLTTYNHTATTTDATSFLEYYTTSKAFYYNIEKKLSILPVILMITGTIGNCLALYVLTRKRLRTYSTMLYFASLTVMDTISLYQWNFNFFYRYNINSQNNNLEESSLFACRYVSFMAYFSLQASAWILTLICIDRYLILTNSQWKRKFSKNIKVTLLIIFVVILSGAALNLPVAFLNGEIIAYNKTLANGTVTTYSEIECYSTSYMRFWEKVMLWVECIIPLVLMVVFNSLLILKTHQSSVKLKLIQQKEKQRQLLNSSQITESSKLKQQKARLSTILDKNLLLHLHKQTKIEHKHSVSALDLNSTNNVNTGSEKTVAVAAAALMKHHHEATRHNSTPNLMRVNSITIGNGSSPGKITTATHLAPPSPVMRHSSSSTAASVKSNTTATFVNHRTTTVNLNRDDTFNEYINELLLNSKTDNQQQETIPLNHLEKRISIKLTSSKTKLTESKSKKREKLINNSKLTQRRNRRIVIMLVLLTTSFAISTFPPTMFYSFFRPFLNNKPYKRLLTLTFTLLRHLSHAFNFLIYFKYSSMIKQEFNTIINCKKITYIVRSNFAKLLHYWCSNCCCCCCCCCLYDATKYKSSSLNDSNNVPNHHHRFRKRGAGNDIDEDNKSNIMNDEYSCYQVTNTNKSDLLKDDEFYIDDDLNSKIDNMITASNTSIAKSSFNSNKQDNSSVAMNEHEGQGGVGGGGGGDNNKTNSSSKKWKLLLYAINVSNSNDRK